MALFVCPSTVVHASVDRIWELLTTPEELARWSDTTLIEAPAHGLRSGDRVVLGAGLLNRFHVVLNVREVAPRRMLSLRIRLPFGVTNDETIVISAIGSNESRVTYN